MNQYACVVQLVNCYIPFYINAKEKTPLQGHPSEDLKTAQAAAKEFASIKNIPFDSGLRVFNPPIISVVKDGNEYVPAELHPTFLKLVSGIGLASFSGTEKEATNMANVYAIHKGAPFIPALGLSVGDIRKFPKTG